MEPIDHSSFGQPPERAALVSALRPGPAGGVEYDGLALGWLQEYLEGCSHEIYRTKLSPFFQSMSFAKAVAVIYERTGAVLFALEVPGPTKVRSTPLQTT
jgi:hypothetical protein